MIRIELKSMKNKTPLPTRPKYVQFAEQVRHRVRVGELKPGDRLPSLSEARDQWGMGRSTLERAHALLDKDGLIVREHGRGTFITHPRQTKTGCMGFFRYQTVQQSLRYPYWTHLIEGMQAAAAKAGMEILLFNPQMDVIRWEKVDGVIATAADLNHMRRLLPVTMPSVALLHRLPGIPSVVADEYSGVHGAVHHLTSLGHRKIGYLVHKHSLEGPLRLAGYEVAMREAGIEYPPEWVWDLSGGDAAASNSFVEIGRHSMRAWLREGFRELGCTALLTQNDETALGAVEVLRGAGIRVPDDISIVGFDGTEVAEYCSPPLTTVVMPLHEMGEKAVELLLQMEQEEGAEQVPHTLTLATHLKVRETTLAPSSHST